MNKVKYFKYVCIGFFMELLAVLVGAIVAYGCLHAFPLGLLLMIVLGVFICIRFGKVHRYCRSVLLFRLGISTLVYSIFAQILPIVVVVALGGVWMNSLSPGNWGGILVAWLVMVGSGVAIVTAILGWVYEVLPPEAVIPQNIPEQTENEKTEV